MATNSCTQGQGIAQVPIPYEEAIEDEIGLLVKRGVFAVSVNENVGVDGDHPPWPSYANDRIVSQLPALTPGCKPLPATV